ncbi:MAG: hypothetical protein ACLFS5_12075 [Spirochaetaceae bacterium]
MGRRAARLLTDAVAGAGTPSQIMLELQLLVRGTSLRRPQQPRPWAGVEYA